MDMKVRFTTDIQVHIYFGSQSGTAEFQTSPLFLLPLKSEANICVQTHKRVSKKMRFSITTVSVPFETSPKCSVLRCFSEELKEEAAMNLEIPCHLRSAWLYDRILKRLCYDDIGILTWKAASSKLNGNQSVLPVTDRHLPMCMNELFLWPPWFIFMELIYVTCVLKCLSSSDIEVHPLTSKQTSIFTIDVQ